MGDYEVINQELELFNPLLAEKPQIVVLNKMDLTEVHDALARAVGRAAKSAGVPEPLAISAVSGEGVQALAASRGRSACRAAARRRGSRTCSR